MQLDGPDLEQLLVRARHEYGSDIRIVKADKVRTGGVGGFFTREHYELSIEVDDVPGPAASPGIVAACAAQMGCQSSVQPLAVPSVIGESRGISRGVLNPARRPRRHPSLAPA